LSGNAAARFEAGGGLALRGNVNRGARAPGLAQVLHSATSKTVDSVTGAEYRSMFLRADSAVARAMGASELKEEKSTGYSLGLVYAPRSDWSFTVDVYRTDIDGRITQTETLTGAAVRAALAAAGQSDITAVSFFQNAVDTRDTGVDITARRNLRYERYGKGSINVGYNRNRTEITGRLINPVLPSLSLVGYNVSSLIEDAAPKDKLIASYTHDVGAWDATLSATHYGKFSYAANALVATDTQSNSFRQTFGAQTVANLAVGWRPTPALRLAAGVRNLFDTHPDEAGYLINFGVTKYSPSSPDGGEGRYFYLSANYDF
jgi:iron complex outermembrane receptor protein